MKTLLIFITSTFIALSANASLNINSIELQDSTVINGAEVSAITLNNVDASIESVEFYTGEIINGLEIKKINLFQSKTTNGLGFSAMRHGGDSGD